MMRTKSEHTGVSELRDDELAAVRGGRQLTVRVIDPTPGSAEEALKKLQEKLNQGRLRAI